MSAFGFEHGCGFAVGGEVRESGVAQLMQRVVRPVGLRCRGFEEFGGSTVGESCPAGCRAQVISGWCPHGSAVGDEQWAGGSFGDDAG